MCRHQLFRKADEVDAVIDMLQSPVHQMNDFGIPRALQVDIPNIESVEGDLIPMILTVPRDLTTRINSRVAAPALALGANTAVAMESVRGHPLSEKHLAEFQHIVKAIYTFLECKHGQEMQISTMPMEILVGASMVLRDAGIMVDIDSIWPDDMLQLTEDPARRAVQLAFFATWIMWQK